MMWGYLRAQAGQSRVCEGPRGKLMLWPQVVCKKMKESLASAEEGMCVHLPHRSRWASVRCGLIQELQCAATHLGWAPHSAGFILRPWGCRTAVSRARPTFSEGPFPSQKNLVCLMVVLTSIPDSATKAAELGAASSPALITSCWAQHFDAR